MIFWAAKGWDPPSPQTALPVCHAHAACFVGSGGVHSTLATAGGGHPIVFSCPHPTVQYAGISIATEVAFSLMVIFLLGAPPCPHPSPSSPLLYDAKSQLLSMNTWILGSSLQLNVHFHLWPSLVSYIPSLSCSPSPLQSCSFQYRVGDSYTLPSLAVSLGCSLSTLWTTSSVCWPWGTIHRRFHLSDTSLLLITAP